MLSFRERCFKAELLGGEGNLVLKRTNASDETPSARDMKLRQSRDRKKGNPSADSGLAGKMRLPQKGREQIGSPMVSGYIKALWPLLTTAASGLDREVRIECKHFFGGAAASANGCIFMTLTNVGVALKLPEES